MGKLNLSSVLPQSFRTSWLDTGGYQLELGSCWYVIGCIHTWCNFDIIKFSWCFIVGLMSVILERGTRNCRYWNLKEYTKCERNSDGQTASMEGKDRQSLKEGPDLKCCLPIPFKDAASPVELPSGLNKVPSYRIVLLLQPFELNSWLLGKQYLAKHVVCLQGWSITLHFMLYYDVSLQKTKYVTFQFG